MKRRQEKRNVIVGTAVRPNAGIRAWYRAVLRALVDDMAEKTKKRILRVYRKYQKQILPRPAAMDANISSRAEAELRELQNQIEDEFRKKARKISEQFVSRTQKYASSTTKDSVKGMLNDAVGRFEEIIPTILEWIPHIVVQEPAELKALIAGKIAQYSRKLQ